MLRVMLVDETDGRAELLRQALSAAGHEVVAHVSSTVELHELVCRHQPDVIIIDTESPDRDTLEHICVVTQDHPRPIVMFSDDGDSGKIRQAVRAGVSAYIVDGLSADRVKPIIDVAIARFNEFQELRTQLAEAKARLEERKLIERAKGILMKQRNFSEEEAYHALRKMAMDKNLRMGEVAERVISVADLLG